VTAAVTLLTDRLGSAAVQSARFPHPLIDPRAVVVCAS